MNGDVSSAMNAFLITKNNIGHGMKTRLLNAMCALLLLVVNNSYAVTVRGEMTGIFTLVPDVFFVPLSYGDPFKVSFEYDSSAPKTIIDENEAIYFGVISSITFETGPYLWEQSGGHLSITNNPDGDEFRFEGLPSASSPLVTGSLTNDDATAFTSTDLPLTIDPSQFQPKTVVLSGGGPSAWGEVQTMTLSAVPIPPAAYLFGSGLIGLIGIARKKQRNC